MSEQETKILSVHGSWQEVVDDCRTTAGKLELRKEPSEGFKRRILLAEHSPIRNIEFRWRWENIKSWVATHWVRHKWECYVKSQRSDKTGVDRDKLPQDAPVDFTGVANVQHLIDTMRKRLCYQASPETRECAVSLKNEIAKTEPEIASVLVPNCIYRCGCPEMRTCGFWGDFLSFCEFTGLTDPRLASISIRYSLYDDYFEVESFLINYKEEAQQQNESNA